MRAVSDLGARADEREMLNGFLDWHRAVVARKVEDLTLEDATRVMTPTGLSPLGVVAHLAAVEYGWFDETFLGNPVRLDLDDHGAFQLHDDDTVVSVVDEYAEACAHSRNVVAGAVTLDDLSTLDTPLRGRVKLRWILVHMIEETARHAGHLDLMRERIDGHTGD
jgi:uncharacterized damage-inducible protein DinB